MTLEYRHPVPGGATIFGPRDGLISRFGRRAEETRSAAYLRVNSI